MQVQPTDDWLAFKRPHFLLRDGRLFFLLSSRPFAEFDDDDAALWAMLDGGSTIGYLKQVQPGAAERLQRFWNLGLCEFAPSSFPPARKRILVVEPHMDDAILSVGGVMWSLRETCEFTLVTVGGRSNFTSYYMVGREFFEVEKISELRRAESMLVMRLLGGKHVDLQQAEAPLRYHDSDWTLDWFKRHRKSVGAFIGHSGSDKEIETWAVAIERAISAAEVEEIWMPLGVGSHADHELTRNSCLQVLSRNPGLPQRCAVYFYQDVPYVNQFAGHAAQLVRALTEAGGVLEPKLDDVTVAFEAKLRLLSIFGSQFKMSYMAPKVDQASRLAGSDDARRVESRYRVARIPTAVATFDVYSGRQAVEQLAGRLGRWYSRHRLARRVRILCPLAIGRWAEDLSRLLTAFPMAILEVHVSESNVAETEALHSPRIDVRSVEGSGGRWAIRAAALALSSRCPMIMVIGEKRMVAAQAAQTVCFLSDILLAPRVNHLVLALARVGHV